MKTAIKLVLIYFVCQIGGIFLAMIPATLIALLRYDDLTKASSLALAPSMLIGFLLMFIYLSRKGYISKSKKTWSFVSLGYFCSSVVIAFSAIILIDCLMSFLTWLPNWMEDSFNALQSGWIGVLCIAILGPILEELLFRGSVTKILLERYSPTKAILFSGLIFGIFHLNPAQVVGAALMGILLAWIYYKTASLFPCILIHIINNSLSVYLNLNFPDAKCTKDILGSAYYTWVLMAALLFVGTIFLMNKRKSIYGWRVINDREINQNTYKL